MDHSARANCWKWRFSATVAIDPKEIAQLLAFAVLRDGQADALIAFLSLFRALMSRYRKALMIDRSPAKKQALGEAFLELKICDCPLHIYRNLRKKIGVKSKICPAFWAAIRDGSHADCENSLTVLQTIQKELLASEMKGYDTFLADIIKEWDNWTTSRISVITNVRRTAGSKDYSQESRNSTITNSKLIPFFRIRFV
jgi:hypothetical protein